MEKRHNIVKNIMKKCPTWEQGLCAGGLGSRTSLFGSTPQ